MLVVLVGPEFEENLSLRYLSAALIAAGHTASMARSDFTEYIDSVVQKVVRERPAIVGLSMVFQVRAREFFALARALRASGYQGHITAGGHFATFACVDILNSVPEIDSIIRQEGEATLCELANALESGLDATEWMQIAGMVARNSAGVPTSAPPRVQVANLDNLPFPIRDNATEKHLGVPTAFMVGSRGCYADCEYCSIFAWHEAAVGKRYRLRTVENIAEEMYRLYSEKAVRFFVFHDDNFFLPSAQANRKRFTALRDAIHSRGMTGIGLMLKLRPNDCDRENIQLLQEIGLMRAFVGIENASQRQLRSLGRDSTIGDVETCLAMLQELDIYATFNILLFDPYTRLEDVRQNIAFLRKNSHFPFNWCKVEPYAGTELEKRYGREGRLIGDYLGYDYRMEDERTRLLYDILLPAFYYRNFDYYGVANLNIGLGYHRRLLKQFYPARLDSKLEGRVQEVIGSINANTLDLLQEAVDFAESADLSDLNKIERFAAGLKSRSFTDQHRLSQRVESILQEIEVVAGVRVNPRTGVSEAFTPLIPLSSSVAQRDPRISQNDRRSLSIYAAVAARLNQARSGAAEQVPSDPGRRRTLQIGAGALLWLLAGCSQKSMVMAPRPQSHGITSPFGSISVAENHPDTVKAWEEFVLEATLQPADAIVVGEPRVMVTTGQVKAVTLFDGGRRIRIKYRPEGASANYDPNVKVTAIWSVRGKHADSTVMASGFIHITSDGDYVFGYETPRPTIAEMAAPPIYSGPHPPKGS